ncbi:MAG: DUF5320 domain-containing protein [Candidatus Humimicrobiaceae bacterium]
MPGFDGTGPLGQGPLTGGGRGYCIIPMEINKRIPNGSAGIQGMPVNLVNQFIPNYSLPYHFKGLNLIYPYNSVPYRRKNYPGSVSRRGIKGNRGF